MKLEEFYEDLFIKYKLTLEEHCEEKPLYGTISQVAIACFNSSYNTPYYTISKGDFYIFKGSYDDLVTFLHNFQMFETIISK